MDINKYYVFYDGDCGFCNYWVQWILKNDTHDQFLFSALQSEFGQEFLKERGLKTNNFNTIYLWKPEKFYLIKSQAIFKIAKILGGKYKMLSYCNILPKSISDLIYDEISKRRMKFAAQKCFVPTSEEKTKFISEII